MSPTDLDNANDVVGEWYIMVGIRSNSQMKPGNLPKRAWKHCLVVKWLWRWRQNEWSWASSLCLPALLCGWSLSGDKWWETCLNKWWDIERFGWEEKLSLWYFLCIFTSWVSDCMVLFSQVKKNLPGLRSICHMLGSLWPSTTLMAKSPGLSLVWPSPWWW